MSSASEFELWKDRDGEYTVPILSAANLVVLEFEQRGIRLSLDHVGQIVAHPSSRLTDDDRNTIRALRRFVLQVLRYQPPAVL